MSAPKPTITYSDCWLENEHEAIAFSTIYESGALTSCEANIYYDAEEQRFFGDAITSDGWVDLDEEEVMGYVAEYGLKDLIAEKYDLEPETRTSLDERIFLGDELIHPMAGLIKVDSKDGSYVYTDDGTCLLAHNCIFATEERKAAYANGEMGIFKGAVKAPKTIDLPKPRTLADSKRSVAEDAARTSRNAQLSAPLTQPKKAR